MHVIENNLKKIRLQIQQSTLAAQRKADSVTLLAVSKTKPASDIIKAYQAGQRQFAESYLQEALLKQQQLAHYQIIWHFIGPIQSNKTRAIAENFSWVHSVGRLKIAQRLSQQRPKALEPLNICLQVNISHELTKSGFKPDELKMAIEKIKDLENIRLRGVMAIPAPAQSYEQQCLPYQRLYQALQSLAFELDTFSFGMSNDLQAAIHEGATMVRIGTALFGARSF